MIEILKVGGKSMLTDFIDFPHDLYQNDPNYVPELFIAQEELLRPDKNPFFQHAEARLLLARKNGRTVGRIAAIFNRNHNAFTGKKDGFFGFFDCINEREVAEKLFEAAGHFLKGKGAQSIIGPVNPSTNDPCGVLVDGFDSPPVIMMTYNASYYDELIKGIDFTKWTDLLAYEARHDKVNSRVVALREPLLQRLEKNGISIRPLRMKELKSEAQKIKELYNSAWDKNLGFVPMTDAEFDKLVGELKLIVKPDFCLLAEKEGKVIGWLLAIPDFNQIFIKIRRGRLFPTGFWKLLTQRNDITALRVLTLGVLEPYRKMGVENVLYSTLIKNSAPTKIEKAECSWLLEDNIAITSAVEKLNARPYKRYRLYHKHL